MIGRALLIILAIAAIIGAAIWHIGRQGGEPYEISAPPPSGFRGPDSAPGVVGPTAPHP